MIMVGDFVVFGFIQNGVCVNVIEADELAAKHIGAIPIPEGYWIGDYFDGENWSHEKLSTETELLGRQLTDLQLDQIEQGQFATELQLQMMEAMKNV